jgi:hypothetical protein
MGLSSDDSVPAETSVDNGPFFRRHVSQARWTFRFLEEGRAVDEPSPYSGGSSSADDMVVWSGRMEIVLTRVKQSE